MNKLLTLLFAVILLTSCGSKGNQKVEIQTDFGDMTVELFNTTPQHRDNFIKLTKEGFYDDLLFHRIINGFMIQGGDPASKDAGPEARLGSGGPGYRIPAEIGEKHFKGRLAAARTPDGANPERESSGSQFYIVHGRPTSNQSLDGIASSNNVVYTEQDRAIYNSTGGAAFLDGQYSVFGQVTVGLDVIDRIAAVQVNGERPVKDVKMKVVLLD